MLAGLHTCTALTSLNFVLLCCPSHLVGPNDFFFDQLPGYGINWSARVANWTSSEFLHLPALACLEKLTFAGPMSPSDDLQRSLIDRLPRLTSVSLKDNRPKAFDVHDYSTYDSDSASSGWSR